MADGGRTRWVRRVRGVLGVECGSELVCAAPGAPRLERREPRELGGGATLEQAVRERRAHLHGKLQGLGVGGLSRQRRRGGEGDGQKHTYTVRGGRRYTKKKA